MTRRRDETGSTKEAKAKSRMNFILPRDLLIQAEELLPLKLVYFA